MHASRAQPVQRDGVGAASVGTTSLAFTNTGNNIDMKYVQLISAGDQASTSYAASPRVMTTAFQTGQDTYPNAQLVTTADGSVIEYLIDSRDFDVNGLGQTVYLEMVPNNMLSNGGSNDEPQLNAEEVMAIENDYLNNVYASAPASTTATTAKKSRYSRMTAAERDRYNARRRQRRLEKKQIKAENGQGQSSSAPLVMTLTPQPQEITIPAPVVQLPIEPPQQVIVESKLETKPEEPDELVFTEDIGVSEMKQEVDDARDRYHEMTERERRSFTQKRTSAFRKQRDDEDDSHIFSSDSSDHQLINSSMDETAIAQMMAARNARRAEKARQRYQRMTVEERRNYNHRRTMAKKARKLAAVVSASSTPVKSEPSQMESVQQILPPSAPQSADLNQQVLSILQQSAMQSEAVEMQQKQQGHQQMEQSFNTIDDTIEQVAAYGNYQLANNQLQVIQVPKVEPTEQVIQEYAEPTTLPLVFIDQHGNPAQLPEGSVIEVRQEHPNGPQTIIIHTATQSQPQLAPPPPSAPLPQPSQTRFIPPPPPTPQAAVVQIITQVSAPSAPPSTTSFITENPLHPLDSESSETGTVPGSTLSESEIARNEDLRAKRAARARERYHNMSEGDRRQFNARRAIALRRARVRDEELCRIGEEARNTGMVLDEETNKAVVDALQRRAKRAESARLKYQRMTMEERRIYNANRDANRKAKKRETPSEPDETIISDSVDNSVKDEPLDFSFS